MISREKLLIQLIKDLKLFFDVTKNCETCTHPSDCDEGHPHFKMWSKLEKRINNIVSESKFN
jgi:hypothetical protein